MTEDQLTRAVVDLAHLYGWLASHVNKSARKVGDRWISNLTGDRGEPDLRLVRQPRLIFAELKTGKKYGAIRGAGGQSSYGLTAEQKAWMAALEGCPGVECYVWTTSDLDLIAQILGPNA